jgi:Lipopolysaccharide kinase (Kdo/WaaP) family
MTDGGNPAGYVRVTSGQCVVVVRNVFADDAKVLLAEGTLYEAAARNLGARPLQGRGIAYAVALPVSGARVVVRRNRHGGLFAPLTRDLFRPPTRAPYELDVAARLRAAGVRTPDVVMYGVYRVHGVLRRADVVTAEIIAGRDLSSFMQPDEQPERRAAAWSAARSLVRALNAAGARHHDLNVKNILLAHAPGGLDAWVLDVDRVVFGEENAASIREGNVARLLRSARKWRDERGAVFDERELGELGGPL